MAVNLINKSEMV